MNNHAYLKMHTKKLKKELKKNDWNPMFAVTLWHEIGYLLAKEGALTLEDVEHFHGTVERVNTVEDMASESGCPTLIMASESGSPALMRVLKTEVDAYEAAQSLSDALLSLVVDDCSRSSVKSQIQINFGNIITALDDLDLIGGKP